MKVTAAAVEELDGANNYPNSYFSISSLTQIANYTSMLLTRWRRRRRRRRRRRKSNSETRRVATEGSWQAPGTPAPNDSVLWSLQVALLLLPLPARPFLLPLFPPSACSLSIQSIAQHVRSSTEGDGSAHRTSHATPDTRTTTDSALQNVIFKNLQQVLFRCRTPFIR